MNFNTETLIRKNILDLKPYSSAREEYTGNADILLDANENPFGTNNRYPDPFQKALKTKLARLKNIPVGQIFIGNGSDEVIDLAIRIFCDPGIDKVLSFAPTYGMYEVAAKINNTTCIPLQLNSVFQIDRESLLPYFKDEKLKIIFICSPNNPTGNLIREEDVVFVLENFSGILILDEAYIDFCEQESLVKYIRKYPNLIVIQTLSKAWGLAGLRLGLAFMNESILKYFNRVKAPYNVSTVNQNSALEALNNLSLFSKHREVILHEKAVLKEALEKLEIVVKVFPSDANFLLVKFSNAEDVYQKLLNKNIIIRNRTAIIENCLRITIGSPEENQRLIKELKIISNG